MRVMEKVKRFFASEEGVVSTEWVALAGAVVIGAITVAWIVLNNLQTPANGIGGNLTACETFAGSHSGSTTGCK